MTLFPFKADFWYKEWDRVQNVNSPKSPDWGQHWRQIPDRSWGSLSTLMLTSDAKEVTSRGDQSLLHFSTTFHCVYHSLIPTSGNSLLPQVSYSRRMPNTLALKLEWLSLHSTTCYHWHAEKLSHPEPYLPTAVWEISRTSTDLLPGLHEVMLLKGLAQCLVHTAALSVPRPFPEPGDDRYGPGLLVKWKARHSSV